jgi:hypothetical protein
MVTPRDGDDTVTVHVRGSAMPAAELRIPFALDRDPQRAHLQRAGGAVL